MAIISVVDRKMGYDDIAFGIGSYTYTDVNGVQHTIPEVSARNIPLDNLSVVSDAIGWHPVVTTLEATVDSIGSASETLYFPAGTYAIADDLTIPSNVSLRFEMGAMITIPNGKTLTLTTPPQAGRYQIFSCTGTGKVSGLKCVYPEWFGAKGDDSTDDTAALDLSEEACQEGGVIWFCPGIYKTTGWLIEKSLSILAESPMSYGSVMAGVTFKAIGAQDYILKLQGILAGGANTFIRPNVMNITCDGDNKAIADAGFVLENSHLAYVDHCGFTNILGHGVRLRTAWELRMQNFFIYNCGTLDTGSAFYIDSPSPLDYTTGSSNVSLRNGTWSSNRGRWLHVSSLANIDGFWFDGNKLEMDNFAIMNTVNTNVLHIGASSRTFITNNTFANFGANYGMYENLIWLAGHNDDGDNGAYGASGDIIRENRYYGAMGAGAINGVYLAANSPPVFEAFNNATSNDPSFTDLPNVNVSQWSQSMNRAWYSYSTSLFPLGLTSREQPGFVSIHKTTRGAHAIPFVADTDVVNDSQTALQLATASTSVAKVCASYDLSRFVGHSDTNLVVRVRMRLSAAGNNTVAVNFTSDGAGGGTYNPVPSVVDSADWTWYEFAVPTANLTTANHFMDIYNYSINGAAISLMVDGMEFVTNNMPIETIAFGGTALGITSPESISYLNPAGGAIAGTLADSTMTGQRKTVRMIDATAASTLTVNKHVTSNPEVFTFSTLGATLVLVWNGTAWATVHNYGVTT